MGPRTHWRKEPFTRLSKSNSEEWFFAKGIDPNESGTVWIFWGSFGDPFQSQWGEVGWCGLISWLWAPTVSLAMTALLQKGHGEEVIGLSNPAIWWWLLGVRIMAIPHTALYQQLCIECLTMIMRWPICNAALPVLNPQSRRWKAACLHRAAKWAMIGTMMILVSSSLETYRAVI